MRNFSNIAILTLTHQATESGGQPCVKIRIRLHRHPQACRLKPMRIVSGELLGDHAKPLVQLGTWS